MPSQRQSVRPRLTNNLFRVLTLLIDSEFLKTVGTLYGLARRLISAQTHEGMYEVLAYESRLELRDRKGKTAIFHKRQKVRFLQTINKLPLMWPSPRKKRSPLLIPPIFYLARPSARWGSSIGPPWGVAAS